MTIKNQNSEQQVVNKNFLSPIGYRFLVKKLPFTNFFVQKVNLPGVSVGTIGVPTPFKEVPIAGDHIRYNELVLTFRVDEDLQNWIELYNWIRGEAVFDYSEYAELSTQVKGSGEGLVSDFSLFIETSKKNPNYNVTFIDGFPTTLTDLSFDIMNESVDYLEATVVFKYNYHTINKVV